eukprot:4419308-Alexandrium_andersonii.AAC.1
METPASPGPAGNHCARGRGAGGRNQSPASDMCCGAVASTTVQATSRTSFAGVGLAARESHHDHVSRRAAARCTVSLKRARVIQFPTRMQCPTTRGGCGRLPHPGR